MGVGRLQIGVRGDVGTTNGERVTPTLTRYSLRLDVRIADDLATRMRIGFEGKNCAAAVAVNAARTHARNCFIGEPFA
jgi:hypothetical protein